MGWSAGAYLAMAAIAENAQYACAIAGAGGGNWTSDYFTSSIGVPFCDSYLRQDVFEGLEKYIAQSSVFRAREIRTPLLLLHGDDDDIVTSDQSLQMFRALSLHSDTPTRFLRFPGESHGVYGAAHQLRLMREVLVWLDRYLFDRAVPRPEGLKAGSFLEAAWVKASADQDDGLYGTRMDQVLVPETVPVLGAEDSLRIGRFEVTQAQWAEFSGQPYPPTKGNHPIAGITYFQATAYCKWLSKKTARRFPFADLLRVLSSQWLAVGTTGE